MDWIDVINHPLAGVVVGAILGGLIGFGSSYTILWSQRRDRQRKIALGFLKEVETFRDQFAVLIPLCQEPVPPDIWEVRNRPFITTNSLYYILRKEMFLLDSMLVDDLLTFYSYLFVAEEERTKVCNSWSDNPLIYPELFEHLTRQLVPLTQKLETTSAVIPELINRLEKESAKEKNKHLIHTLTDLLLG